MVHLGTPRWSLSEGTTLIEVDVTGETSKTMWFRLPDSIPVSEDGVSDALFPLGLLLAMATDGTLVLESPVSARLIENAEVIQDILLSWHGHRLRRAELEVVARPSDQAVTRADGVASCFTGGVDSFYTLLKHRDEITTLVYVHGFDIPLARKALYDATASHLRAVAADVGTELIEMASNLKSFYPTPWATITHGPALVAIGMILSGSHGTLLLPASHTYSQLYRWGTHPLLDPLWSTDGLTIVHDGAEASRVRKTVALADFPAAQQHLRVCWQNTGAYNCGKCNKCMRTKTCLRLAGKLELFRTFDHVVDVAAVRATQISNASELSFVVENRDFAREVGDEEIADALTYAIDVYNGKKAGKRELQRKVRVLRRKLEQTRKELDRLNSRKSVRLANRARRLFAPLRRKKGVGTVASD